MYCSVLVNCELYSVLPLNLVLESTHCLIDDGTSRDCNAYLKSITSLSQCIVDVKFKFLFMNTGIACVDVKNAKAKVGPYQMPIVPFEDVYSCDMRKMCKGDVWDLPVRKRAVNICSFSGVMEAWPLNLEIFDMKDRVQLLVGDYSFNKVSFERLQPSPVSAPSRYGGGPSKGKNKRALRKLN